uniref:Uncharacterized protein n=1 Tax=Anguilla anguilla TaxID=7936 RepID=A0A0E9SP67_ANGAN
MIYAKQARRVLAQSAVHPGSWVPSIALEQ